MKNPKFACGVMANMVGDSAISATAQSWTLIDPTTIKIPKIILTLNSFLTNQYLSLSLINLARVRPNKFIALVVCVKLDNLQNIALWSYLPIDEVCFGF